MEDRMFIGFMGEKVSEIGVDLAEALKENNVEAKDEIILKTLAHIMALAQTSVDYLTGRIELPH